MQMKIHNTLTNSLEEFVPLEKNVVKMYVCGPTVYNFIHVGNARPLIVFDTLRKYLKYRGYDVLFVQNYTDIDDKMINRANEEGVTIKELAARFIKAYEKDANALNVMPADIKPRATEHIGDIIKLIKSLESKGYAYKTNDGVYFDTRAYKGYGKLSGRDLDDLLSGARVKVDENKKAPSDFALWKSEKPGEPSWGSPWGKGRPGWHIECSAMSQKYLGDTFDIHGGGVDLIFPHHENEIAQSEGATGKKFVNYWMHNGHINVNNEKMSKSKGNFFTIPDIAEKFDLEVLRFFMLGVHYRSQVNFSFELMEQAQQGLTRLYGAKMRWEDMTGEGEPSDAMHELCEKTKQSFDDCMDSDLNTAGALGALFELVRSANYMLDNDKSSADAKLALETLNLLGDVLGILYRDMTVLPNEVKELAEQRVLARKEKNWKLSDELRDKMIELGYAVEDTAEGQKVKKR
jgi:cysteinyl-tRNA synthetase